MNDIDSVLGREIQHRLLPNPLSVIESGQHISAAQWKKQRSIIRTVLEKNVYGFLPTEPKSMKKTLLQWKEHDFHNKATHEVVALSCEIGHREFTFPVHLILPTNAVCSPVFVHITFSPDIPHRYFPVEEILDAGFGMASFCYEDVMPDRENGIYEGLASIFHAEDRDETGSGALGYWAWAAHRVMDYLLTHSHVDPHHIALIGHSRLGKTALWAGALDERFSLVIANESGCGGAALERGKIGERIADITKTFPYWFCKKYSSYSQHEETMPCDQHYLLSLIAPRLLYVASAKEDIWADPKSEFLGCVAASSAYEMLGEKGLIVPDAIPVAGESFHEGSVGYHIREGEHALTPEDWQQIMLFWKKHM